MNNVYIYKPAKSATQSGQARTRAWILTFETDTEYTEPLMGWTGSRNTQNQVKLFFHTQEDAIAYAEKNKMQYILEPNYTSTLKPKSYGDNFKPR